jgi:hypothetical protein
MQSMIPSFPSALCVVAVRDAVNVEYLNRNCSPSDFAQRARCLIAAGVVVATSAATCDLQTFRHTTIL